MMSVHRALLGVHGACELIKGRGGDATGHVVCLQGVVVVDRV